MKNNLSLIALLFIVITGLVFRLVGLNWDRDQHLHPDERFLTMVTQAVRIPGSLAQYLSPAVSPANPANAGFPFFVYGTLPVFMVKVTSLALSLHTYNGITLVGRFISAILDGSVIILVWLISEKIFKNKIAAAFSAFFYALSVLPVQLSHFYAVDTFMTAYIYLVFYLIHLYIDDRSGNHACIISVIMGFFFGLAVSSKVSAVLFSPVIIIAWVSKYHGRPDDWPRQLLSLLLFGLTAFIVIHLAYPYLFSGVFRINPQFAANMHQLKSFEDPSGWYPPSVQWIHTTMLMFPLTNIFLFGLGIFMSIIAAAAVIYSIIHLAANRHLGLHLFWIFSLFIFQGIQFIKPMRYFYPIYPSLAVVSGFLLFILVSRFGNIIFLSFTVLGMIVWPLAFISIYSRPHTRISATEWIKSNIPEGSTLSCEYWDDCLPLGTGGGYHVVQLPLYNPDNPQKWSELISDLGKIDYLVLSSNRLYGSISAVPEKYPLTSEFYRQLFSGRLGFRPVAQFTSRPGLPFPGIKVCITPPAVDYGSVARIIQPCQGGGLEIVDDYADESWTVYDHPKVIIFSRS